MKEDTGELYFDEKVSGSKEPFMSPWESLAA